MVGRTLQTSKCCVQEEDELSEPCGSELGDMMTPPQPAPRSPPAQEASEAEMSFRDLVDESDEEEQAGRGGGKSLGQGQVLVDPEDLQVSAPHTLFALLSDPD